MKQIIKNYSFDKTARTVTFTDFSTVSLDRLFLITNVTAGTIVYQFNDATRGGSVASNVLTLVYDTSGMSNADKLQIVYNSAAGDPVYDTATPSVQGTVAAGTVDSGNPVKVGGRYNVTAPTYTDGQRGDLQLDAQGNLKSYLVTKLDNVNDSITTYPFGHSYTNIITNATTTVKAGPGVLTGIIINNPMDLTTTKLTMTLYDNTTNSGLKIGTVTIPAGQASLTPFRIAYSSAFTIGLTVVTAGPAVPADITVEYR